VQNTVDQTSIPIVAGKPLCSPVGLIAGNGSFPVEFASGAKEAGLKVVAVAHIGETDPRLTEAVSDCLWIKVGELGRVLDFFKQHGVQQAAFAGGIKRINLFGGVKLDLKAIALLARIRSVKDDVLLRGVASELENIGIDVFSAHLFLRNSLPIAGPLTRRGLSVAERRDAIIGWEAAKQIGLAEIGQSVVVNKGMVVAVEAVEGTDGCIERAGQLVGNGCTVVKCSKPQQDLRLDLPTIGPKTVDVMRKAGATALVIEAGRCLILDREETVRLADAAGISIVAFETLP
jgi:DUF1009 family protein